MDGVRILPLYLFPGGAEDAALLAELLTENLGTEMGPREAEAIEGLRTRGEFPAGRTITRSSPPRPWP